MNDLISSLEQKFGRASNTEIAQQQKAYMKDQFEYFGIKAPERKEIVKPYFSKGLLPPKESLPPLIKQLWSQPQREYQYFGQELLYRYRKRLIEEDIDLLQFMIVNKPWWDTVDYIAAKLLGSYFEIFPERRSPSVQQWLSTDNIWLLRSSILFQLKYRDRLDTDLLTQVIQSLLGSKEFFINKAIGWILREYSKTDPKWVITFVESNPLHPLSRKEAMRLIRN